jgi:gentisate 1,2-dioxygenase
MKQESPKDSSPLWSDLVDRARHERERKRGTTKYIVTREEAPEEITPFGRIRWYLHPMIKNVHTKPYYAFELFLPAGSESGKLAHQGQIVHLIIEGGGYSNIGRSKYDWSEGDVIGIPPLDDGVELQHFADPETDVRMLIVFPNLDSALGPDIGSTFEVERSTVG